jgi:hypothetical protein
MKQLLLLLPLTILSVPAPVQAQQMNTYQVCTNYQESYAPGYYDRDGNYRQGNVGTNAYNTQCGSGGGYNRRIAQQQRICNPEAGALLGAGIAGAIVGGDTYNYSESYYNNGNSGGQSGRYSSNNYWRSLGAGLGALMFGC